MERQGIAETIRVHGASCIKIAMSDSVSPAEGSSPCRVENDTGPCRGFDTMQKATVTSQRVSYRALGRTRTITVRWVSAPRRG